MKVPRNIILITIDSLRNDMAKDNLLNLDSIQDYFIFNFKNTFSNGPGTNQSFPSIMSSTTFLVHGGLNLKEGITSIAEVLKHRGFYTVGFHSNPFLSSRFGWNRGFIEFYDFLGAYKSPASMVVSSKGWKRFFLNAFGRLLKGSSKRLWGISNRLYYIFKGFNLPYLDAHELNRYILTWAENNKGKYSKVFLWVHYMDVHYPYAPPEKYLNGTKFESREKAFFYNYRLDLEDPDPKIVQNLKVLYKASIRFVSDKINDLLDELKRLGFLEDSIVIITSDHGEAFLEHGRFGHTYDTLYNEVLKVPLIFISDAVEFRRSAYEGNVQLLDLSPTIVDLVKVKKPATFRGRSLVSLLLGDVEDYGVYPIYSESAVPDLINLRYDTSRFIVSVLFGRWKLIMDRIHSSKHDTQPSYELYDLISDPNEKINLYEKNPDVVKILSKLLEDHLSDVRRLRMIINKIQSIKYTLKDKKRKLE